MKNLIQKLINFFGYKLIKLPSANNSDFDDITKFLIDNPQPVVMDVGANIGQSIDRYKQIFKSPIIHSFEPSEKEFNYLKEKYKNFKEKRSK